MKRKRERLEEYRIDHAIALLKKREVSRALETFREELSDPALSLLYQGYCFWEQGELDEAIQLCQKALEIDPDLASAHLLFGLSAMECSLEEREWRNEVHTHLKRYLELRPEEAEIQSLYRTWCAWE